MKKREIQKMQVENQQEVLGADDSPLDYEV